MYVCLPQLHVTIFGSKVNVVVVRHELQLRNDWAETGETRASLSGHISRRLISRLTMLRDDLCKYYVVCCCPTNLHLNAQHGAK